MQIPFGKYRGISLKKVPDDYLEWLGSIELHNERLRLAVEIQARRPKTEEPVPTLPVPSLAPEIITAGFRSLAKRFHPDHGGNHEKMLELNQAADWLRARLGSFGRMEAT